MTDSKTVIAHAFPHIEQRDGYNVYHPGLTKREYFAAMAVQGCMARLVHLECDVDPDELTAEAVGIADALITTLAA
jgi:hypothetical protein